MPGPDKLLLLQKRQLTKLEEIRELKIRTDYFKLYSYDDGGAYFKASLKNVSPS